MDRLTLHSSAEAQLRGEIRLSAEDCGTPEASADIFYRHTTYTQNECGW